MSERASISSASSRMAGSRPRRPAPPARASTSPANAAPIRPASFSGASGSEPPQNDGGKTRFNISKCARSSSTPPVCPETARATMRVR